MKKLFHDIKKINLMILFISVVCLSCFGIQAMPVQATNSQLIKVGVFDLPGFYETNDVGIRYGYGYDYLNEIAKYTNFEYEFVQGTWEELLSMLQKGEIDLLDSMQHVLNQENLYLFSSVPTGTDYSTLFVKSDNSTIAYEDFENLQDCKVGIIAGSDRNSDFYEYAKENHFTAEIVEFKSAGELSLALQNGDVEAIMTSNLRNAPNEKVVARFSPLPFYMATHKDNTALMYVLDNALKQIQINELHFNTNLYEKHYKRNNTQLLLTRHEKDFIAKSQPFTMVFDPDWAPFEYYDEKTQTVGGINADILALISARSGIQFNLMNVGSYETCIEMVGHGEVDFLMSFDSNITLARDFGITLTEVFLSSPFAIIGRNAPITDDKILALPEVYIVAKEYAKKMFPNNEIVIYEDIFACYDAIMAGKADYTFDNLHVVGEVIRSKKYPDLVLLHATSLMDSFSVAARSDIPPILIDILNKAISTVTIAEVESIVYNHTIAVQQEFTLTQIVEKYKTEIMLTGLFFILMALLLAVYVIETQKKSKKVLWKMAYIDELTGVSNLSKFKIDAENLLRESNSEEYWLVRFDVEKFKIINEMFGFHEGNRALINIVKTVENNLQEQELFARIGNDDFAVLIKKGSGETLERKKFLYQYFLQIHMASNTMYHINFPIGIYKLKPHDKDINAMLEKVTMAHKSAKLAGADSVVFFNDEIRDNAIRVKDIENTMHAALEHGEFVVYMQPKFHLDTSKISGAEALIRWNSPTRGLIAPNDFIPIFEKNGFIINIDNYVLEKVCEFQRMLLNQGLTPISISVNQSSLHIKNPSYVEDIKTIVSDYQIPPELIELELTETIMHDDINALIQITAALQKFGLMISIDDFGSGYSSLNLLKDLTANILKIDREFLMYSEENERGKIILSNIIRLAKELDMDVVIEGVETKAQEALLKTLNATIVQGYLYAKPMPIDQFFKLL